MCCDRNTVFILHYIYYSISSKYKSDYSECWKWPRNNWIFNSRCPSTCSPSGLELRFYIRFTLIRRFLVLEWRDRLSGSICVFMNMVRTQKWGSCFRGLTFSLHTVIWITKTNLGGWKIWHQLQSCDQSRRVYTEQDTSWLLWLLALLPFNVLGGLAALDHLFNLNKSDHGCDHE